MRPSRIARLIIVVAVLAHGATARAERADAESLLDQAVEAYDDLRVEASLDLLARAERRGGLEGEDLARLHLYRGLSRAALGQSDEAEVSFRAALAEDPDIALPEDLSPVVRRQFEDLRDPGEGGGGGGGGAGGGGGGAGGGGGGGAGGGGGGGAGGGGGGGRPSPPPPPPPHRLLLTWVGLGLTGAALVAGGTAAILAEASRATATASEHAQPRADELLAAYRVESQVGFALLSTAVALGITTLILWLGERDVEAPAAAVHAGPSSAGLSVTGPLTF